MKDSTITCQLGYDPAAKRSPKNNPAYCDAEECQHCGWNPEERERRRAMQADRGFTLHQNGCKGLVIPRKDDD